jgi:hypothetical protein
VLDDTLECPAAGGRGVSCVVLGTYSFERAWQDLLYQLDDWLSCEPNREENIIDEILMALCKTQSHEPARMSRAVKLRSARSCFVVSMGSARARFVFGNVVSSILSIPSRAKFKKETYAHGLPLDLFTLRQFWAHHYT